MLAPCAEVKVDAIIPKAEVKLSTIIVNLSAIVPSAEVNLSAIIPSVEVNLRLPGFTIFLKSSLSLRLVARAWDLIRRIHGQW